MKRMKLLTFTTLYPSAARPGHALSIETRLRHLVDTGEVESRVIAPVPWFPSTHPSFGLYSLYTRTPREEERHGIRVLHPRYPAVPRIGYAIAPFAMAVAVRPLVARLTQTDGYDAIDAHCFYPDGVAAAILGGHFRKPVVITACGAELVAAPRAHWHGRAIRWAAARAAGIATPSRAVKNRLVELGVPAHRITVLPNGVDLQRFRPVERDAVRARLRCKGTTLLTVGSLGARDGNDLAIAALELLPECNLIIAGEGPEQGALAKLARDIGVADRVTFAGVLSDEDLREYYGAADALVFASSRGGWANVPLESLACGTPVIATDFEGCAELITTPAAGLLVRRRTPQALAQAVRQLFERHPSREDTRRYAERYSWNATTEGQLELFSEVLLVPRVGPRVRAVEPASENRRRQACHT